MTTYVPLTLSDNTPPFQTTVTLDGNPYFLAVTWNVAAQRWYVGLNDQYGNVTWIGALVGSSLTYDIPLAPGIFTTSTILFREDTGNFEISP